EGEVDAHFSRHLPYLETEMDENGYKLTPFEGVHIEPLGIYSDSLTSLDELEDGAVVGVPNDPTNRGRALALLAEQGLLTIAEGIEPTAATPADTEENPQNPASAQAAAALIPRALSDFATAVINDNCVLNAGMSPADDPLVLEDGEDNPYSNMLVVRTEDAENEALVTLDELLHSDDVRQYLEETFEGAVLPAF